MLQQAFVLGRADFKEIAILGQGNFSKVFRVRGRRDGYEYAIKRSLREIGSDACYMQWMKVRRVDRCLHIWSRHAETTSEACRHSFCAVVTLTAQPSSRAPATLAA